MAARRQVRRGRGFKPSTTWNSATSAVETAVAAATKVLLATQSTTLDTETIRRTRGLIAWRSDQVVADEAVMGAFGMCVVSADAAAAGVASVPGPFTDPGSDLWFVHQFMYDRLEFQSGTGVSAGFTTHVQYLIDSSAMRKVTDEERLILVVENGHASNGATFSFNIRFLSSASRG